MTDTAARPASELRLGEGSFPPWLQRVNWGAFFLPTIWALFCGTWRWFFGLAAFSVGTNSLLLWLRFARVIPQPAVRVLSFVFIALGLLLSTTLALRANRLVWERESRRVARESDESIPRLAEPVTKYMRSQRTWALVGACLALLTVASEVVGSFGPNAVDPWIASGDIGLRLLVVIMLLARDRRAARSMQAEGVSIELAPMRLVLPNKRAVLALVIFGLAVGLFGALSAWGSGRLERPPSASEVTLTKETLAQAARASSVPAELQSVEVVFGRLADPPEALVPFDPHGYQYAATYELTDSGVRFVEIYPRDFAPQDADSFTSFVLDQEPGADAALKASLLVTTTPVLNVWGAMEDEEVRVAAGDKLWEVTLFDPKGVNYFWGDSVWLLQHGDGSIEQTASPYGD